MCCDTRALPLLTSGRSVLVLAASNYGPADSRSSSRLRCSTLVHITTVRTLPLTTLRRVTRNVVFTASLPRRQGELHRCWPYIRCSALAVALFGITTQAYGQPGDPVSSTGKEKPGHTYRRAISRSPQPQRE